jgi:hypothetical protein
MFVNFLGDVAPNRFPILELITDVITVNCTLMRRGRFRCRPSVLLWRMLLGGSLRRILLRLTVCILCQLFSHGSMASVETMTSLI